MNRPFFSRRGRHNRTLLLCSVFLTCLLGIIYFSQPRAIHTFVLKSLDQVTRLAGPDNREGRTVVVTVDDASLEQFGQWPWPRELLAELLDTIRAGGASVIGVEILLSEQGRTVTGEAAGQPPGPGSDAVLAQKLGEGPFVLGYSFGFEDRPEKKRDCTLHPAYPIIVGRKGVSVPHDSFYEAQDVICSLEPLMAAVPDSGFLNGAPDSDGLLRRLPLIIEYRERLYPSFILSMLEQVNPDRSLIISRNKSNITTVSLGAIDIPTDNHGNFLLGRDGRGEEDFVSAAAVLNGDISPEVFRNAAVIVGISAAGLSGQYATPSSPTTSPLVIHRNALDSLLSGSAIVRTEDFITVETVVSIVSCLLLVVAAIYTPIPLAAAIAVLGVGASWMGAVHIFRGSGYLFSPLLPSVTLLLNLFLLVTMRYRHYQMDARVETDSALSRLEISKQELQSILTTIPEIIYRLDPEGRITFISPAVEKYGVTVESLLKSSIFDLISSTDINKARYVINERRTGERAARDVELRLRLTESGRQGAGEKGFFSVSASGIYDHDDDGNTVFRGTQGIIRDINEQKLLERQLMKSQKLEVMGNLASRVAHDLNNILSGLVSYPDLLLQEMDPADPMYDKISSIRRSGKQAAHIVQDLLTLARRSTRTVEVCDLSVVVKEFMESIEFEGLGKRHPRVRYATELAPGLMKIKGSGVHLHKVLMNIVTNSAEAMGETGEGQVVITTSNVYLDKEVEGFETIPRGEYVCLEVTDTGGGIEGSGLHRIFEPFYSEKRLGGKGTGLGLTIVWATVKDHGGFIDVRSWLGHGTTVSMYLPVTRDVAGAPDGPDQGRDLCGTETVLVVDDAEDQLDIARSALRKFGYTVLTAVNGEQAVKVVEQHPVDLVLLDMVMPGGMGGVETYRKIVARYPACRGVATSGFFEPDSQRELEELGVRIFLDKPYTIEKLSQAVRAELDREIVS